MKKDDLKPFDEVADSMAQAAGRSGIPIEAIKAAKRAGCDAFRGSRVHLGKLREWLASAEKELSTSNVLLMIVQDVARIVAEKLPRGDARFRADSRKLTVRIHEGFGAALIVVEQDKVDDFLSKSSAIFEGVFKMVRKKPPRVD